MSTGSPLNLPKPKATTNTGQDMIELGNSLQKINDRIKNIEANIGGVDVSSLFTVTSSEVTAFDAYRVGNLVWIAFNLLPSQTGYRALFTVPVSLRPVAQVMLATGTAAGSSDAGIVTSAYIGTSGTGAAYISAVPSNRLRVTGAYVMS